MRKSTKSMGLVAASLIAVLLLWVANEQLLGLVQTSSPWVVLVVSLAMLGAGSSVGLAFAIAGVRLREGATGLLLAATPFGALLIYQWYWLSGWVTWGESSALGRFLVSEPAFLGAPMVVGVAVGLAIWPRREASDVSVPPASPAEQVS